MLVCQHFSIPKGWKEKPANYINALVIFTYTSLGLMRMGWVGWKVGCYWKQLIRLPTCQLFQHRHYHHRQVGHELPPVVICAAGVTIVLTVTTTIAALCLSGWKGLWEWLGDRRGWVDLEKSGSFRDRERWSSSNCCSLFLLSLLPFLSVFFFHELIYCNVTLPPQVSGQVIISGSLLDLSERWLFLGGW